MSEKLDHHGIAKGASKRPMSKGQDLSPSKPIEDDVHHRAIFLDPGVQLLSRIRSDDDEAFQAFYEHYVLYVRNCLSRMVQVSTDLDDLTQEVFLRIWTRRRAYQPQASARAYLMGYARNVAREHNSRLSNKEKIKSYHLAAEVESQQDDTLFGPEIAKHIEAAKSQLSDEQRQAITLALDRRISLSKAAREAGLSEGALRQRWYTAKKKLEVILRRLMDENSPPPQNTT